MRFLNIENAPLYALTLVVVLLLLLKARKQQADYYTVFGLSLNDYPYRACGLLFLFSLLFGTLALLRPQGDVITKEIEQKGRDIALVVDVSYSMLSEDVRPSRLDLAKRKVASFLRATKGDRVALVTFSGVAFAEVPLTIDYSSIRAALQNINPTETPLAGTSFVSASEVIAEILSNDPTRQKAAVFITDGEDFTGSMDIVVDNLKKQGVVVFSLGVGTTSGGDIVIDGQTAVDGDGNKILTKLEEDSLITLAAKTGGDYFRATASSKDVNKLYEAIEEKVVSYDLEETELEIWSEYFQIPLLICLILLLIKQFLTFKHGLSI